jgi:hypothetical protein
MKATARRVAALLFVLLEPAPLAAQPTALGWPEVIDALTRERTQAEVCVGLIKSHGDKQAIREAMGKYELAKADIDGVIAGLTTALVEGGNPDSLPFVRARLESSGLTLRSICAAADKAAPPNTKGVWEDIARGAVEPLIKTISDGVGALWSRRIEKDKLEVETKKAQLEAARWPEFRDIGAL